MQETRILTSRRITRSSKPSTSSEADILFRRPSGQVTTRRPGCSIRGIGSSPVEATTSKQDHTVNTMLRNSRTSQRRRGNPSETELEQITSSSAEAQQVLGFGLGNYRHSKNNEPTTSASTLRRSAREPRPKRTLSPTPMVPRRRPRLRMSSLASLQGDDLKENNTGVYKAGKMVKLEKSDAVMYTSTPSSIRSSLSSASDIAAVHKRMHSIEIIDCDKHRGTEESIADEDIENDLVDIQPFENGENITEVFVNMSIAKDVPEEQHVDVSIQLLTIPLEYAYDEDVEHSTVESHPLRTTMELVPSLEQEVVVCSSLSEDYVDNQRVESLEDSQESMDPEANFARSENIMAPKLGSVDDRCEHVGSPTDVSLVSEDATSEMGPPVLDGPILESSSYDLKPNVEQPPKLTPDGEQEKESPKPMHYVVGEIYRVHTPNGTEQEVQLAVMDDGSEALVNASGDIVDLTPEDTYATIDICDIDFNFLDDKNVVCGLCGEVVLYATLFTGHLSRVHPEMLDKDMMIGDVPYIEYLKGKLESDKRRMHDGFKVSKQTLLRRTPRKVSQIRINPSEMTLSQLEVALRKKLLEKMSRRVNVSLVDKEHVKCGVCSAVISINKKFEIVHVIRHFNAWHPTNHQCAGMWQKRTQRPGVGKPLSKQDFAVIDLSHTHPDNLQCIWCGMFIDATTIAVHFTDCHSGEVEVPKCLLCIQELVINARVIEKFGSDFDIVLPDEYNIKVRKLNKLFTSESNMDVAIERYLDALNDKRKRAPPTVERRVFEGDNMVLHTTDEVEEEDVFDGIADDVPRRRKITNTNSRMVFGRHNKPKRSMVQPFYRQAAPPNSEYVKVISESHWKCKICDSDIFGAVISACAIRHFKLKHPQDSDSLQFEVVRARLDRISDGCMEFVHPQMLECLICHLTYQLHKPYNVCRGIRHLKSKHPEIMPEFNGEPLRRYRKTGTALRLDDDPNIPRRRPQISVSEGLMLARMKVQGSQLQKDVDKVPKVFGDSDEKIMMLISGNEENEEALKDNMNVVSDNSTSSSEKNGNRNVKIIDGKGAKKDFSQEVVFELSYDYNNLDADGNPRKHLVRVTPNSEQPIGKNLPNKASEQHDYFAETEFEPVVMDEQQRTNHVYFTDPNHCEDSSAEEPDVVLGDVLFLDQEGNEIIQRTTSLPDGSIQTQFLGQGEDGTLYVLDDIVSTDLQGGTHVDQVYGEEDEVMDDSNRNSNIEPSYNEQTANHPFHVAQQQYCDHDGIVDEPNDFNEDVIVRSHYGSVLTEENYNDGNEATREQTQYGQHLVVNCNAHHTTANIVPHEEGHREEPPENLVEEADTIRRVHCDTSDVEQSVVKEE